MYHVSSQGVDERMINVHYYYKTYHSQSPCFVCVKCAEIAQLVTMLFLCEVCRNNTVSHHALSV